MLSDDMQLVRDYAESGSEQAFSKLVAQHVNLVYSVALRKVRDAHLAEEITQNVFVILARKAKSLKADTVLSGWLCRTARYVSADTLKIQRRRQIREQEAHMQSVLNENEPEAWVHIAPILDDALGSLDQKDHDAVVLRYFEGKDLREVGASLGMKEDAARMRVNRGLEKLRKFFSRKGVALSVSAIAASVAANSVQAAPAGLAAVAIKSALAGTAVTGAAAIAATKAIAMTTLQKTLIATALAVAVGTGVHEARQAGSARSEMQTLRAQQAPLNDQIQRLQHEREEDARQFASLREENERLKSNTADLLKLRAEVDALRSAASKSKQAETDPVLTTAKSWVEKADVLKKWVEAHPDQQIPEFQYLWDYDWLDVVKTSNMEGENAPRNAMSSLREAAKRQFGHELSDALKRFVAEHDGELPAELSQLNAYMLRPMSDALLNSYKLLHTGKLADVPKNEWLVSEIVPPYDKEDKIHDRTLLVKIDDWQMPFRTK
jgi:RNA polymerase sigma factor (sigma-70 family)